MQEEMYMGTIVNVEVICINYGWQSSWASTNAIFRFIQRHSSLFITPEERIIEGKRCLNVFL
jgi:hypothetical protein